MTMSFPRCSGKSSDHAWMLLLSDLMALLLSVFVLIHAMSNVPSASWQALRAGLAAQPAPARPDVAAPPAPVAGSSLSYVSTLIDARRGSIALLDDALLQETAEAFSLVLPAAAVFDGTGALLPAAGGGLAALGGLLRSHGNRLSVAATDVDWGRALARAEQVAAALAAGGYDRPVEHAARRGPATRAVVLHLSVQAGE